MTTGLLMIRSVYSNRSKNQLSKTHSKFVLKILLSGQDLLVLLVQKALISTLTIKSAKLVPKAHSLTFLLTSVEAKKDISLIPTVII